MGTVPCVEVLIRLSIVRAAAPVLFSCDFVLLCAAPPRPFFFFPLPFPFNKLLFLPPCPFARALRCLAWLLACASSARWASSNAARSSADIAANFASSFFAAAAAVCCFSFFILAKNCFSPCLFGESPLIAFSLDVSRIVFDVSSGGALEGLGSGPGGGTSGSACAAGVSGSTTIDGAGLSFGGIAGIAGFNDLAGGVGGTVGGAGIRGGAPGLVVVEDGRPFGSGAIFGDGFGWSGIGGCALAVSVEAGGG